MTLQLQAKASRVGFDWNDPRQGLEILRATNLKFERRFAAVERALKERGKRPQQASLAEMDTPWDAAKAVEKLNSQI